MKRKRYAFPLALVCIALTSLTIAGAAKKWRLWASVPVPAVQAAGKSVSWIPYQITYTHYASTPDYATEPGRGDLVVGADIVQAVRSDGSRAESSTEYRLDRSIVSRFRMLELSGGIRVRVNDTLRLMTATKSSVADNAHARQALDPSTSCTASYDGSQMSITPVVSQEQLLGYECYKIVYDMKLARRSVWRAPALGCADLRDRFEKLEPQSGRIIAVGDRVAVDVRQGDPDPSLFELPTGYRNVPPSELASAYAAHCCKAKLGKAELEALESADRQFREFRFEP